MNHMQKLTNHFIDYDEFKFNNDVVVISREFKNAILTHIIGNYNGFINMPLYLAIYGNPGEGKTFQTMRICYEYGIKMCYFSGSELSGNYERDSILEIEDNYSRACNYYYGEENIPCVMVIDDFHLSPASVQVGIGTTVNSQILTGFLMNLCDKAKNASGYRIPIILLGNTFQNVYEPLKRDGRMDFFHWEAPNELKREVVKKIFVNCLSKRDFRKIDEFVNYYNDRPISFFTELRNDIEKEKIVYQIESSGKKDILMYLQKNNVLTNNSVSIEYLYKLANRRIELACASDMLGGI